MKWTIEMTDDTITVTQDNGEILIGIHDLGLELDDLMTQANFERDLRDLVLDFVKADGHGKNRSGSLGHEN